MSSDEPLSDSRKLPEIFFFFFFFVIVFFFFLFITFSKLYEAM